MADNHETSHASVAERPDLGKPGRGTWVRSPKKALYKALRTLAVLLILYLLWAIASRRSNPLFLPKPEAVWHDVKELSGNGILWRSMWISFARITLATLLASLVSVPIGLLMANYKLVERLVTPVTSLMRYIPVTVFYPLLILWLGIGENMKVTFLFVATFFFFLPTVTLAVKEISQELVDTAYTMGMSSLQVMLRVLLPSAMPAICESFLMMYGIGWTYVIIVETVNAQAGLGHIMNLGLLRGRTDLVLVAVFAILLISKVFFALGKKTIRSLFFWKYAREISSQ